MADKVDHPVRVLYVEDEKELQIPIAQMLEFLGYEVACADNGKAGVAKAESWQPDVILMDVRMPVMDGPEAIRTLRRNPDTAEILIYVLSAFTDSKTRISCEEAGANGFFAKPLDIEKFDELIKGKLQQGLLRP
jgi:CheY-like chemotaxis protein